MIFHNLDRVHPVSCGQCTPSVLWTVYTQCLVDSVPNFSMFSDSIVVVLELLNDIYVTFQIIDPHNIQMLIRNSINYILCVVLTICETWDVYTAYDSTML